MTIRTTTATCEASRMNQVGTGSRTSVSRRALRAATSGWSGTVAEAGAAAVAATGDGKTACATDVVRSATTPAATNGPASWGDRIATIGSETAEICGSRVAKHRAGRERKNDDDEAT